jgi:hypothetical protein
MAKGDVEQGKRLALGRVANVQLVEGKEEGIFTFDYLSSKYDDKPQVERVFNLKVCPSTIKKGGGQLLGGNEIAERWIWNIEHRKEMLMTSTTDDDEEEEGDRIDN